MQVKLARLGILSKKCSKSMTFQVEINPIAEAQIEQAYRWYRGLMNTIATLQEKPQRCALAIEHEIF